MAATLCGPINPALAGDTGMYFSVFGGGTYLENSTLQANGNDVGELTFDTGWNVGGAFGQDYGNLRAEIEAEVPEKVNGVIFAMGGFAGGVSLYALDGELFYEYSALLLKRDKFKVGTLPAGDVTIALEMRTPLKRMAPAELKFWINGAEAANGTVRRTVPAVFTASETFDVGMDTSSPVANDYFDKAPFKFEGTLKRLHFKNLPVGDPGFMPSLDDD
jgi:hypothetical protein